MNQKKLDFSREVVRTVCDLCAVVFNINSNEQLEKVFGISHQQLETVINKIIDALPDHIFIANSKMALDEIKNICAREFVFFQAQERWGDQDYQQDLANFIHIFSRDIEKQTSIKNYQTSMKEE